jgi:hypothetical protein
MGNKQRAEIEAVLSGTKKVESDALSMAGTFEKVATRIQSGLGSGLRAVGGALSNVISGGLQAAGVFQSINLAAAVQQAKQLDAVTARLGQSAGVAGSSLKASFEAAEGKTLTSAVAMAEVAKSLGRVTYDGKFAAESLQALGDDALAVGRELPDQLPLAAALHGLGVQSKDVGAELGRLTDIAERLKLSGGPSALKDTIAALGPQLAGVAADSDQARAKLEALVGVMSKGLKPERAREVSAGVLNAIKSRALEFERITGRQVLDANGQVQDPTEILRALKANVDKRFGKGDSAAKRRALMAEGDLGLALMRTDFSEVDRVAASARDTGATAKAAEAFRQSTEGKRLDAQLVKERGMRSAGEVALGIHDTLVDKLGVPGAVGAELVGGQLVLSGGKALAGTVGKGLAAAGGGTAAAAGLVSASFAAPAVGVLAEIGEKTEVTGARYLNRHADIAGEGLARRAMREGEVTGAMVGAKGDAEVQRATLLALEKLLAATAEGNELLRSQVAAGIAAEFRRAPIYARTPTEAPQ